MQNDVLKNNIAPWQEKGRWYHALFDSATQTFVPEETDSFLMQFTVYSTGSGYYAIYADSDKFNFIDVKMIPREKTTVVSALSLPTYRIATTGNWGIPVAPAITSGKIDVYVFCTK